MQCSGDVLQDGLSMMDTPLHCSVQCAMCRISVQCAMCNVHCYVHNQCAVCTASGWPWTPHRTAILLSSHHSPPLLCANNTPIAPIKAANRIFNSRPTLAICANKIHQTHISHLHRKHKLNLPTEQSFKEKDTLPKTPFDNCI